MFSSRFRLAASKTARRGVAAAASRSQKSTTSNNPRLWLAAVGLGSGALVVATSNNNKTALAARLPTSGDVISSGTPVKEAATGILFPQLCNGYYLAGTGVRIKYAFVKVYAVGTYLDPLAVAAVKKGSREAIEQALLDPTYPRTIRIVMNRNLSIEKYTEAIVESLKPRMHGKDLDKLEEFKSLNPPVDLVQGAEIEMTIRGDTLLYKNAAGGVGTIRRYVVRENVFRTTVEGKEALLVSPFLTFLTALLVFFRHKIPARVFPVRSSPRLCVTRTTEWTRSRPRTRRVCWRGFASCRNNKRSVRIFFKMNSRGIKVDISCGMFAFPSSSCSCQIACRN